MLTKSDVKSETKANVAIGEKHSFSMGNFKPYTTPRRKAGIRDDQISISKHSIALPITVANKLGHRQPNGDLTVALLWSDADKAIAVQKAADGDYKLKQVGKNKSTRAIYAKAILEAKKVKPGRYSTTWDEKNAALIAKVG